MARRPTFSVAVAEAYNRRLAAAERRNVRFQWFLDEVSDRIRMSLRGRVRMATEYLRDKIVRNISVPVVKATSIRTRRVMVLERSVPGEFPRADMTLLMKSIFSDVRDLGPDSMVGYVGQPLDYGVILELRMKRGFLVRTLREEEPVIARMLTGPIK